MWQSHRKVPTIYNVKAVSLCLAHGCANIQMMNANPPPPVPFRDHSCAVPIPHQSAYVTADEFSFPTYVDYDRMCSVTEVACPSVVHSEGSHMSLKARHKTRSTL